MMTLYDRAGRQLEWFEMGFSTYKLQCEKETLATVTWRGKLAIADVAGERWLFKGSRPLSEDVKIYPGEAYNSLKTAIPLASFEFRYRELQQELRFVDGRSLTWNWERAEHPTLICKLPDGQDVLCVRALSRPLFNPVEFMLEIFPQAGKLPEIPLLVCFSLYLVRLLKSHSGRDLQYNGCAWMNFLLDLLGSTF